MPTLFRDVRLPVPDAGTLCASVVYYHDGGDGRVWITWPALNDGAESSVAKASRDIHTTLATRQQLVLGLQEFIPLGYCDCERHDDGVVHLKAHKDAKFTCFGWRALPDEDADDPCLACLIPTPPMLNPTNQVADELERLGINTLAFNRAAIQAFIQLSNQRAPTTSRFSDGALFLGFQRRYLHATTLSLFIWKFLDREKPLSSGYIDAIGSATFQQVVYSVGIHVFNNLSSLTSEEVKHTSGASFDVTIAKARDDSALPPYKDNSTRRRQWKRNALLVLKRPKLSGQSDLFDSLERPLGSDGDPANSARVSRTVINELLILSHPPLRNHPNIIHLFGISWDNLNTGSVSDVCPILVQSCADHGNLDQYLLHMTAKLKLSWSLRCDIIRQILTGLRDLHACGIVHGDIKTLNILVATTKAGISKPRVMLSDFGYSIIAQKGQDQVEVVSATKRYASPEMYRCLEGSNRTMSLHDAFASDIYSFGLTACTVALGLLGNEDIFRKVAGLEEVFAARGLALSDFSEYLDSSVVELISQPDFWEKTKVDEEAHLRLLACVVFLVQLEAFMREVDEDNNLMDWISPSLTWSPGDRLKDVSGFIEHLKGLSVEDGTSGGLSEQLL